MTSANARTNPSRRNLVLVGFAVLVIALGLGIATTARAASTPVGPLPAPMVLTRVSAPVVESMLKIVMPPVPLT